MLNIFDTIKYQLFKGFKPLKSFINLIITLTVSTFIFISCSKKHETQPSFYFWKTNFSLSDIESECLKNNNVKILYVRFFDVDLNAETNNAIPLGVIDSLENKSQHINIIPVVFITNRTFLNLSNTQIKTLASNIVNKINSLDTTYNELQIDCDWSQKTKTTYFNFLNKVKKQLNDSVKLTCTIRLHQVKYPDITGIPPVDGGMLMFYNMGNINNLNETNSIYDADIAKKYVAYVSNYKLHLDVALPIFNWVVHYRNDKVFGLITKKQLPDLTNELYFYKKENKEIYLVKTDELINGVYYKKGDVLKKEILSDEKLIEATQHLKHYLSSENRRVVLYDLDELNIKNYEKETLKTVFTTFSN